MRNLVLGGAWLGSLVLAWLLGTSFGFGGDDAARSSGERKATAPAAPRGAAPEGGSGGAAAGDSAPAPPPSPDAGEASASPERAEADDEPFTLEGLTTPADVSAGLMAYADRKLKQGPEGHKQLLKTMDALMRDRALREMLRDESRLVPLAYPWVKFLVDRDRYVVAMTETIYKTAAEDPQWFAELDDDTLEPFTEGIAVILSGAADEKTMARFREYAEAILAHPPDTLPESLKKNLRDIQQALQFWAPPVAPEDMLRQLADPTVSQAIKLGLLGRVDPSTLRGVDVAGILAPAIQAGNHDAMRLVRRFPLGAGELVALDRAFIEGAAGGTLHPWTIHQYMRDTKRETWALEEPFLREGLRRGGKAVEVFAQGMLWLPEQAPKSFAREVLANYTLPDNLVKQIKERFQIE